MRYFYSTKVIAENEAHPFDYEHYNHKDHILVIKKPFLELDNLQYFSLNELLQKGWRVLWMIRDGRDVISSMVDDSYHVDPDRWMFANKVFLKACMSDQILPVRYESLVTDHYTQMQRIKSFIGQSYQDYDDWFNQVNTEDPMNYGIVPRPITSDSIGNYKNHPERILNLSRDFRKLLTIFGYEENLNPGANTESSGS
jgi:hypothetical protein